MAIDPRANVGAMATRSGSAAIDLPAPVARFRSLAADGAPRVVETLAIETTAWMRRPWMPNPLEVRMAHRLGYEFVHEIRIGRGALSFRFGLDAYVGGHGLMKVGPRCRPASNSIRAP